MSWDPAQYLRFGDERTRPAADLLARVPLLAPGRIVDLGCGPGNSTALLANRYPRAELTGLDNSPEMLARARREGPQGATWVEADIAAAEFAVPIDLLFSNAALQWVPDHLAVLPRLVGCLSPGGVLAIQLPRNFAAPSHQAIRAVAARPSWAAMLAEADGLREVPDGAAFYDALHPVASAIDIWETEYLHLLSGEDPVLNWVRGTALTPFLARLPPEAQPAFLDEVGRELRAAYPPRASGITVFPFRRVFCVAVR